MLKTLFVGKEPSELRELREALAQNEADRKWADSLIEEANGLEAVFSAAESRLAAEPGAEAAEAYVTAALNREIRAPALRRSHGLVAPRLLEMRLERTQPVLIKALERYCENLEARIQTAVARDLETAQAIGCDLTESEAVRQFRSEIAAARATIVALGKPLGINEAASRAGTVKQWCKKILGSE